MHKPARRLVDVFFASRDGNEVKLHKHGSWIWYDAFYDVGSHNEIAFGKYDTS